MNGGPQPSAWFTDLSSLTTIDDECWQVLSDSVCDRDSGWRLPVLASLEDSECRQRTVVLRSVDADTRTIGFHTDVRSPKVQQIRTDPRIWLLFYDRDHKVQLRVAGTASVHHHDDMAAELWNTESAASLQVYLAPRTPGTPSQQPDVNLPPGLSERSPDMSELQPGFANFAVIRCRIRAVEWLLLHSDGHRRAQFQYQPEGVLRTWLAP